MASAKSDKNTPEYIIVGRITRPHGVKGAVRVEPLTEDPNRFHALKSVWIGNEDQPQESFDIQKVQVANKFVILSFLQIQDRNKAELLRQKYLFIHRDDLISLDEDDVFLFELVGMTVHTEKGEHVGIVQDVIEYPASQVLIVQNNDHEYMIPDVPEIVIDVNAEKSIITIRPIEGLLD